MDTELALLPLLALPAVAGGITYFLRGWTRAPQLAAMLAAATVAYFTQAAAAGLSGDLMGRALVLDLPAKQVFLVTLIAVSLTNLVLAVYPTNSMFPPVSLICASCIGLAVTMDNLTLASLTLLVAAVPMVLAWSVQGKAHGHLQYLVAMTLGALTLAYAGTVMAEAPDVPSRTGLIAFQVGAGLLLALVPFGLWEGNLSDNSDPLSASLASLSLKPAAVLLVWRFTGQHQWLVTATPAVDILRVAAVATVGYCALRAAVTSSPRVYAAVASQGQFALVLLTLIPALGSSALLPVTGMAFLARVPTVLLLALAAALLADRRRARTGLLLFLPAAALLGLPGTPLFPAHLTALLALARPAQMLAPLAALAVGLAVGCLRLLSASAPAAATEPPRQHQREALAAFAVVAAITFAAGLQPSVLLTYLR